MVQIREATSDDTAALAALAAESFPAACPPHTPAADIQHHIVTQLSPAAFDHDIADGRVRIVVAVADSDGGVGIAAAADGFVGYAMTVAPSTPPDGQSGQWPVELRRIYTHPQWMRRGVGQALLESVLQHADRSGHDQIWLGTNEHNSRAIAFYRRNGFEVIGAKTFTVGTSIECDHVMARSLPRPPAVQ